MGPKSKPGILCGYSSPLSINRGTMHLAEQPAPSDYAPPSQPARPHQDNDMIRTDPNAPKHGLPPCLHVPIAASSIQAIKDYVGTVEKEVFYKGKGKDEPGDNDLKEGEVVALLIRAYVSGKPNGTALIWQHAEGETYARRLFPIFQIWVHVAYRQYRQAYKDLEKSLGSNSGAALSNMPLSNSQFLDHVQNRKAIMESRNFSHCYVRLCPVSPGTNSSGGHSSGAEGMEKDYLKSLAHAATVGGSHQIIYADPVDLTKMMDLAPGTVVLAGVAKNHYLFYNSRG